MSKFGMGDILKQAQKMQEKMQKIQEGLTELEVEGSAGGGMVTVTANAKQEILDLIDQYRLQYIPLIVPITLINHFIRKYDEKYLAKQYYLNPHPIELKLRNHV